MGYPSSSALRASASMVAGIKESSGVFSVVLFAGSTSTCTSEALSVQAMTLAQKLHFLCLVGAGSPEAEGVNSTLDNIPLLHIYNHITESKATSRDMLLPIPRFNFVVRGIARIHHVKLKLSNT